MPNSNMDATLYILELIFCIKIQWIYLEIRELYLKVITVSPKTPLSCSLGGMMGSAGEAFLRVCCEMKKIFPESLLWDGKKVIKLSSEFVVNAFIRGCSEKPRSEQFSVTIKSKMLLESLL